MKKWRCLGCGNEVKTSDNADQLEATEKAFEELDKDQTIDLNFSKEILVVDQLPNFFMIVLTEYFPISEYIIK